MSSGRFKEARELFVVAAATPVEERDQFLKEACGDDADLRAEVEELLRFHDRSSGGGSELATPLHPASILPDTPERIGRYKILQKIGSGGMGEVFEAQQDKPLRRRVALKIIKWGMDTEQVVARFESERQALALMDHPNVARVFDAGATEQGRPFFAMELVKGVPITEFCDATRLPLRDRLELFIQVCRGVQHAHRRGIIHRDIKPSNILVTDQDGVATPKIIDFGVAKATSQQLTEETVFTELGQWIGTPEYMSPEQAGMGGFDIDTRTDVYSLGVLLYELLVGIQPFTPEDLRSSGFDEMRRKIRDEDPPRPSTRVTTTGKSSPEMAERLRTDPPTLARLLRGDLDWIVMKTLEKDRNRRYGSPAEIAADLERHLNDEAVVASPPSVRYRLGKFVRRHRAAVIAGGLILVSLVSGLAVATVGMVRAQRAERLANTQVELLVGMFDSLDPMRDTLDSGSVMGGRSTAEDLLSGAQERIDTELGQDPLVRAQLNATLGRIYMNLGNHEKALAAWEEAHEIRLEEQGPDHPDVLTSTLSLGTIHDVMGNYQAALVHFRRAAEMRTRLLGPDHPDTAESLNSLAFGLWRNGDYEEAAPLFERALEIRVKVFGPDHAVVGDTLYMQAVLLRDAGEFDRARNGFERALAIREAVYGHDHTAVAWVAHNYGLLLAQLGETDHARANFERALSIQEETFGPDNFMVIAPLIGLATLDLQSGDLELARQRATRAVGLQELKHGKDHHFVASGLDVLAQIEHRAGNRQLAMNHLQRGLRLREAAVGANHPQVATSLYWLARLSFAEGSFESAAELYERRQDLLEAAYGRDHRHSILNRINIAWAKARSGRLDTAARLYRENGRAAADLVAAVGATAGTDLYNLGCLAALVGEPSDAVRWLRQSLELGVEPSHLLEDTDLEGLRGEPDFEALVRTAGAPSARQ